MSDYKKMMKALDKRVKGVPTAAQVRARFIYYENEASHCAGWIDGVSDEHGEAFDHWLNEERAKAWHEGYGHGREDQAEETRTGQMHVTLNPHALPKEPGT